MTAELRDRLLGALSSGLRLAVITGTVVLVLSVLHEATAPRIEGHLKRALVTTLIELTGDPRLERAAIAAPLPARLRLCEDEQTRYWILRSSTSGYSGPIDFIVALDADDRILGVRVLRHTETPGLGDAIEVRKSDWILKLGGHTGAFTHTPAWAVREDGGAIDAVTGATITSRALLSGVAEALAKAGSVAEEPCMPLD